MADRIVPPVRPDAMPADPEARDINPFKRALNTLAFGTSDPSYKDIGEVRAKGQFMAYQGLGQMASAVAHPEVRASIHNAYANQGAQAAQAMRQRYYDKEYTQMMQVQFKPLKERMDAEEQRLKERIQVVHMPVARTVGYEEGKQRALGAQMISPGNPEQVQAGTTKDGKPKTQMVEGTPPPEQNPAAGPGMLSGVEMMPEQPSFIDPVTGQPVPILSPRGFAIQQEAFMDFGSAQRDFYTEAMDVFAQYPGNPLANNAMTKIMDSVIGQSGKAATGQADPNDQIAYWQDFQTKILENQKLQAEIEREQVATQEGKVSINKGLHDHRTVQAEWNAQAQDGRQRALEDETFMSALSKRTQNAIREGKELTAKQTDEVAAQNKLYIDNLEKETIRKGRAGMVRVPPVAVKTPHNYPTHIKQAAEYAPALEEARADRYQEFRAKLLEAAVMPEDQRDEQLEALGFTDEKTKADIRAGNLETKEVQNVIKTQLQNSKEDAADQARAYFEVMTLAMRDQEDLRDTVMDDNERHIATYIQQQREAGTPEATIQANAEKMRADVLGTHFLSIHPEDGEEILAGLIEQRATVDKDGNKVFVPVAWRPKPFEEHLENMYYGPKRRAPHKVQAESQAKEAMSVNALNAVIDPKTGLPVKDAKGRFVPPPKVEKGQPRPLTQQLLYLTPANELSQAELSMAIPMLRRRYDEAHTLTLSGIEHGPQRKAAQEVMKKISERLDALTDVHRNFFERIVDRARDQKEKQVKQSHELLRVFNTEHNVN